MTFKGLQIHYMTRIIIDISIHPSILHPFSITIYLMQSCGGCGTYPGGYGCEARTADIVYIKKNLNGQELQNHIFLLSHYLTYKW